MAQDPAPTSSQSPAPQSEPAQTAEHPQTKKPKKQWTNENLGEANGVVSQVGDAQTNSGAKPSPSGKPIPAKPVDAQYVATLRSQLQKLQTQIADTDKEIVRLDSFKKGETPGCAGLQLHRGYNATPIDEQIQKLQVKRKQLQERMDALLDDARKKGVAARELP
jgi:hypothetical protein